YGITDDEIEDMLIEALDHGEEDLAARRLADARVEGERVLSATLKSLSADSDLLEPAELQEIERAISELREVLSSNSVKAGSVTTRVDALDEATKAWAGRRMNRAIMRALSGQDLEQVATSVAGARGV